MRYHIIQNLPYILIYDFTDSDLYHIQTRYEYRQGLLVPKKHLNPMWRRDQDLNISESQFKNETTNISIEYD